MDKSFWMNVLIVSVIVSIVGSLSTGLYFLIKDAGNTKRTARALSVRMILSFSLFILLFLAFAMGWIAPHSLFHD